MEEIPIREAANSYEGEVGEKRLIGLLADLIEQNRKIVEGPVEDVPVLLESFWVVGFGPKLELFYFTGILGRETDTTKARLDLLERIERLEPVRVAETKLKLKLLSSDSEKGNLLRTFQSNKKS